MRLKGKRTLITGAGAGLGKSMALQFAAEGAIVMVSDLSGDAAAAVVDEIVKAGGTAIADTADVTREADIQAMVKHAADAMGGIDCLINNAGIEIIRPVTELPAEDIDRLLAINVRGLLLCCKHAVPHLASGKGSSIINLASAAGLVGWPLLSLYCASKGAVVQITRSLAQELKEAGIRVNALCPSVIGTDMGSRFLDTYENDFGVPMREVINARQIRIGTPEEVATAAAFLASDEASFISGAALPIDNGVSSG